MPFPSWIVFTLCSNIFFTSLWKFLSSGNSEIFNPVSFNLSIGIPVNYATLESSIFLIYAHCSFTQSSAL
jgi:hypothetical protein